MYLLSRLLLILALVGFSVGLLLAALAWPCVWFLPIVIIGLWWKRRSRRSFGTLGTARWAEEAELHRAGIAGGRSGLILGRLASPRPLNPGSRLVALLSPRLSAKQACRTFFTLRAESEPVIARLSGAVHTAIVSPTGGGKGVSCVIPFLLTCPESCVILDFKGENALLTAAHRQKTFGHRVVVLDLFHIVTRNPDTLNPLDSIRAGDPRALDACNGLAKALVVRSGDEKEPHWNDSAEAHLAALLGVVACHGDAKAGTRSLQTVKDILARPDRLELALKLMSESDAWGGMLARMGGNLAYFVDKEKGSVLTTVGRHTRFLDTPAVAESTKASSFDPADLRSGKMTVYLVLPPEHMRAQAALLRMWINTLMRAVVEGGLNESRKIHFVLDEAASLGHLDCIDDALDKYRGYGVRMQLYYQSLGQLKTCFPNGQDQTLLSNTSQTFFGVNDNATAEYVSNRLGEETILVASGGTNRGRSWSTSVGRDGQGGSESRGSSENWNQQARKLLKPEEVIALHPRTAITFTPGVRPILTTLLRHYEEPWLSPAAPAAPRTRSRLAGAFFACLTLAGSVLLGLAALLFVLSVAAALSATTSQPAPQYTYPQH